jgi:hypothetical protein
LLVPLSGSFLSLVAQARRTATQQGLEAAISDALRNRTLTFGQDSELVNLAIDWGQNPPLIRAAVRVSDPRLPTARQVAAVQSFLNNDQPIRFRLVVQRLSVDVIGPETAPNPAPLVPKPAAVEPN